MTGKQLASSFLALGALLVVAAITLAPPSKEAAASKPPEKPDSECRIDLKCWAERHSIAAGIKCREPVERLAKYESEWTDRWYEPKFSHFTWGDKNKATVTYVGDRIRFKNGFGAWQPHVYRCTFDPDSGRVDFVYAEAGRL